MYKNHVRHGLEELYKIIMGVRPVGIAEPHFIKAMDELTELERLAEIGKAVEWAFDARLFLYSGYEDENWVHIADNKELLEAYRKAKNGNKKRN